LRIPLAGRPLRPGIGHRVHQLAHELRGEVHAPDDAGNFALVDLVVDPRERDRGATRSSHRLGVVQINSTPNHPTTCGKVERFHQAVEPRA
jgi:hypothetical protein